VGPFHERVKEIREEHGDLIRQAGEFRGTRTDVKGSIESLEMLDKGLETADDAASTAVKEGEDLAKRLMAADDPYRPRFPQGSPGPEGGHQGRQAGGR
jgi:hypothetical protein